MRDARAGGFNHQRLRMAVERGDDDLLDELEEALIATDIGVNTTLEILDNVRRAIARKSINDIDALKQAVGG